MAKYDDVIEAAKRLKAAREAMSAEERARQQRLLAGTRSLSAPFVIQTQEEEPKSYLEKVFAPLGQARQGWEELHSGKRALGAVHILNALLGLPAMPAAAVLGGVEKIPKVGEPISKAVQSPFEALGWGTGYAWRDVGDILNKLLGIETRDSEVFKALGETAQIGTQLALGGTLLKGLIGKERVPNATKEGEIPQGNIGEHPRADTGGTRPETGGGHRVQPSEEVGGKATPETQAEEPKVAPTPEPTPKAAEVEPTLTPAYKTPEGEIVTGANHPEILEKLGEEPKTREERTIDESFGFLNEKGEWLSRKEADKYAEEHNLKIPKVEEKRPEYQKGQLHSDEIKPSGKTSGIRQETLERTREGAVKPGQGIPVENLIEYGRHLLTKGVNPLSYIDEYERTGNISVDAVAVGRAMTEQLDKAKYDLQEKLAADPNNPELQAAFQKASDAALEFSLKLKPLETAWGNIGRVMQGETDVDTGSFQSMSKHFEKVTGRTATPEEAAKIKSITENVKKARDEVDKIQQKLYKSFDRLYESLKAREAVKPAEGAIGKMQKQADLFKMIWEHARKHYIDQGGMTFEQMVSNTAQDLGLSYDQVVKAFAANKSVRNITIDAFAKMYKRRQAVNNAKAWLEAANRGKVSKAIQLAARLSFGLKVLGHAVAPITHAGWLMFREKQWWVDMPKTFRFFADGAYHEAMMQAIENDPLYKVALQAKLNIDPNTSYDPYQQYLKLPFFKTISEAGVRSMDVLKVLRFNLFKNEWERTPEILQNAEYAKRIATTINHATGFAGIKSAPDWLGLTLFAPNLELARWHRIIGDPAQIVGTLSKMALSPDKVSAEEARAALFSLRGYARFAGTYLGALELNNAMLQLFGSKQQVNLTDPTKSDWMRFKAIDNSFDVTGGLTVPLRLVAQVARESVKAMEKPSQTPANIGRIMEYYVRGKLSPFAGSLADLTIFHADYLNRPFPTPLSFAPGTAQKPKYTWPEYVSEEFGPIPFEAAVREIADIWRTQGFSNTQITDYLKVLAISGGEGLGIRIVPEQEQGKGVSLTRLKSLTRRTKKVAR